MREPETPFTLHPGWTEDTESWAELARLYRDIRDTHGDPGWVSLQVGVRSILTDDEYRVLDGADFFLDKDSGPALLSAIDRVAAGASRLSSSYSPSGRSRLRAGRNVRPWDDLLNIRQLLFKASREENQSARRSIQQLH